MSINTLVRFLSDLTNTVKLEYFSKIDFITIRNKTTDIDISTTTNRIDTTTEESASEDKEKYLNMFCGVYELGSN